LTKMTIQLRMRRRVLWILLIAASLFLGGCRKSAEKTAPTSSTAPAVPDSKERHHRLFTGGVSPLIVSLSPETIPFHDGHAPLGRYSLTYEIDGAEKAKKAYISLDARGVGVLQQFDVDLQPRGKIEFFLDASNIDLGPTVRFRAHCPGNDTDWFLMGSDPLPYPEVATSSQIGSVLPAYVETSQRPLGGNFPVTIKGAKITKDCTAEAQIDGNTVELKNAANFRAACLQRFTRTPDLYPAPGRESGRKWAGHAGRRHLHFEFCGMNAARGFSFRTPIAPTPPQDPPCDCVRRSRDSLPRFRNSACGRGQR
jgi:hypothetical protein